MTATAKRDRLLTTDEVMALFNYSRASLMRIVREGRDGFPAPIQISDKRIAWRESDVMRWIATRPPARSPGWQRREAAQ